MKYFANIWKEIIEPIEENDYYFFCRLHVMNNGKLFDTFNEARQHIINYFEGEIEKYKNPDPYFNKFLLSELRAYTKFLMRYPAKFEDQYKAEIKLQFNPIDFEKQYMQVPEISFYEDDEYKKAMKRRRFG